MNTIHVIFLNFHKDGIYSSLNYSLKGLGIDDINYSVASIDFREYQKIIWRAY